MTLAARQLDATPDVFALARALAGRPGLVVAFAERGRVAYVSSDPVDQASTLDPEPELERRELGDAGRVPRWFGLVPYEACRALEGDAVLDRRPAPLVETPLWLRYPAVARVADQVSVIGESELAVTELCGRLKAAPRRSRVEVHLAAAPELGALHASRIRRALEHIGRGDVYEVNLARRLVLRVQGSAPELVQALGGRALPPHAFALDWGELCVAAASPELCLSLEPGGRVLTSPIKGTRPRHTDVAIDAALAAELDRDPKERAELTMIIDVERNDLGRVANLGSVRLVEAPHVVSVASVHHRVATLEAQVPPELGRGELLSAMLPSGSVTGAPKRRAMQLIAELEPERRGLYTGTVGFVRHDGGLELAMAIRTLVARAGLAHFHTGGGIVADSDPEREVEETRWKAEPLLALVRSSGGNAENWAV